MNMRKNLLLLTAVLFISIAAFAQNLQTIDDVPWNAPWKYLPKQSALAMSPTAACNQGEEPFKDFIRKWNASEALRKERVYAEEGDIDIYRYQLDGLEVYGVLPVAAGKSVFVKTGGGKMRTYRSFYNVTANTVGFCQEGCNLNFARIDGKWYLVFIGLAG